MKQPDPVVVIGAGLVGLASARAFARANPRFPVIVLEKESAVASHQSGHNSGVLHAGLYYRPGSAKARLAVQGIRAMVEYCADRGIPYERCGKLVVSVDESEVPRLRALLDRGTANGLTGLRWLSPSEAREREPEVDCTAALHVPEEGIVDFPAVARSLARDIAALGGEVRIDTALSAVHPDGKAWRLETNRGDVRAQFVVNCAGLHADRVANWLKAPDVPPIIPFRGDYYKLRHDREHLVRHLIYPVPDPAFPFLGVHFTRLIGGGVECGPSAVLALKREGYGRTDVDARDALSSMSYPGMWRFLGRHPAMVAAELWRTASRKAFTRRLQRLLPALEASDLVPGGSGVRAQAITRDGRLVEDFLFREGPASLHVLNAPSPAATASLAIGDVVARRAIASINGTSVSLKGVS
ncbi:MAG TPA: L-2-hydroxyglutarate oxidase [Longimicrobiales bacterium]|nr:L-2-hydroxyglutarate oxidase [Longimicrobiales bacterium]